MDAWEILKARGFIQQHTDEAELRAALAGKVTYYVGFDPTADSLHVGHLIPVMAMAWLQRCGHRPIAVVGGGTGMVGDPSGRTELRQLLTPEVIAHNLSVYRVQLARFLKLDGADGMIVDNADWLLNLNYVDFLRDIGRHFSVNRMLAAEGYKMRWEKGLSFIELNYQIMQAYDFLELYRRHGCSLQLGGDDQWSNILAGADLIRRVESQPAHVLTQPLIMTASGQKMGKTAAGAVWLDVEKTSPFNLYQYWLNVDDRDVGRMLKLYTFLPLDEIAKLEALQGADIREAKRVLAWEFTALVHGKEAADAAEAGAKAMAAGEAAEDLPTFAVSAELLAAGAKIVAILADSGLAKSKGEAKRLIENGGVRLGSDKVASPDAGLADLPLDGVVLRVGKKQAVRLIPA